MIERSVAEPFCNAVFGMDREVESFSEGVDGLDAAVEGGGVNSVGLGGD